MKRNFMSLLSVSVCIILLMLCMAGCGSANEMFGATEDKEYVYENSIAESVTSAGSEKVDTDSARKVIEYITLDVETKNFDELMSGIEKRISELGGYVESSDVSGNGFENENNRYATYKIRIPVDKTDNFSGYVSENSNVTRKKINTEDVTLEYVDVESRLKALETEKQSLEQLLSSSAKLSDIITVRDRLTEVIAEIESYKSRLRTLDNLVDYTTITLNVSEVEHTTVVKKQTVWQEIGNNLKTGFRNVGKFLKGFFVFAVSAVPYVLVLGVIGVIVLVIIKLSLNSKRKRNQKKDENTKV